MTDELPQAFSDFSRGVISPEAFQHGLLTLCKMTPERAWEALALLDQHFRRGKIAPELQHSLRQRIERQALGIETYQPRRAALPMSAVARAIPVAPDADAEDRTIETIVAPEPALPEPPPTPPSLPPSPSPVAIIVTPPPRAPVLALERAAMRGSTVRPSRKTRPVAASARWRPYFRISPAIALTAMMLAVAASPTVEDGEDNWPAAAPGMAGNGAEGRSDSDAPPSDSQAKQNPDTLSLSSDRYIVDQDRGVAELSVERSPTAAGDTSFLWWTEGSGAKPNEDYVGGKPRRVQIPEGAGSSTLRIPILANPKRRHVEMFYVLIGRPEGNTGIGPIHRAAVFLLPQRSR
jgi:hypothetical protein